MSEHKKMNKILSSAGIVLFAIIIITAAAAASMVSESGIINVSYAQVLQRSPSTRSEITTPGQNPVCDPTDRHVNTRESHVCGIPKTPSATGAAAESPSSISPGANPMCDPTDTSINTTESHVCGIPKTPSATGGAAAGTTTTESPSSISPTSPGSLTPPSGSPLESIPGLLPITTNNTQ
jgi:hypothetical protein